MVARALRLAAETRKVSLRRRRTRGSRSMSRRARSAARAFTSPYSARARRRRRAGADVVFEQILAVRRRVDRSLAWQCEIAARRARVGTVACARDRCGDRDRHAATQAVDRADAHDVRPRVAIEQVDQGLEPRGLLRASEGACRLGLDEIALVTRARAGMASTAAVVLKRPSAATTRGAPCVLHVDGALERGEGFARAEASPANRPRWRARPRTPCRPRGARRAPRM